MVNSTTHKVYVSNYDDNTVSVIDGATNTVAATIPVGVRPYIGGVNEATNTIFIPNTNDFTLSVIDGATNTVSQTFALPSGIVIGPAVVSPADGSVYVTSAANNKGYVVGVVTSPTITSGTPTAPTAGTAYSFPITASGTAPITYSVTSGTLPTSLSLNASTGVLSGTPTAAGTFSFTITATNGAGHDSAAYRVVVAAAAASSAAAIPTGIDAGYAGPATRTHDLSSAAVDLIAAMLVVAVVSGAILIWRRHPRVPIS